MTGRNPESVEFGPFRFVPGDGLWRDGHARSPLPPRALGVLTALLATPGGSCPSRTLMDAVWPDTFVTESSLLEAIGLLREALGDDRRQPTYIQTVHRRGYRFIGSRANRALQATAGYPRHLRGPAGTQLGAENPFGPILVASAAYASRPSAWRSSLPSSASIRERRTSRFSVSLPIDATIDPLARLGRGVARRHRRWSMSATASGRSQLFLRTSIATSRRRLAAPRTPAIRSSRPTANGSASSRAAACRRFA